MRAKRLAETLDRVTDSVDDFAPREVRPALLDEAVPELVADSFVERAIADDRKTPRLGSDENQCGVGVLMTMEADVRELTLRSLERIDARIRNNANGNYSGRPIFGGGDCARELAALLVRHGLKLTTGAFSAPGCAWK